MRLEQIESAIRLILHDLFADVSQQRSYGQGTEIREQGTENASLPPLPFLAGFIVREEAGIICKVGEENLCRAGGAHGY
jgi:hypothetical protein